jgi:predicted Zn-dependent protease
VSEVLPTKAASQIREVFRNWPHGSLDAMDKLAREYPRDPVVQYYLGLALAWAGYNADAVTVLERVKSKSVGWDTVWEIRANDLLYQRYFPGYPVFEPIGSDPLLRRGAILQQQGHQHSAERLYLRAARRSPANDEAQVAAAVGLFDKADITTSFARLGPLTKRFPRSQSVRYYLALLLAYTGRGDGAIAQMKKTVALGKGTPLGTSAQAFLAKVAKLRTAPAKK